MQCKDLQKDNETCIKDSMTDVHRSTGKISSKHYRNIGSANIKKLKTLNIPSQHTPMFPLESSFCIRMLSRKLLSESTVKLSWDCSKTDRLKYGRHRRSFKSMEHWMDKTTCHLPLHGSYWATQLACGYRCMRWSLSKNTLLFNEPRSN